jgi:hypothetical protein
VGGIITLFRPARRACRDSDIWLGLVLLFCLVGLASFKLAFGAPRPIAVIQASAASREMPYEIGTGPFADTLTKGDRLPVTYVSSVVPLATGPQVRAGPSSFAAPEIKSRHWHDPITRRAAQSAIRTLKSKASKKNVRRVEDQPTALACTPDKSSPLRLLGGTTTCSN